MLINSAPHFNRHYSQQPGSKRTISTACSLPFKIFPSIRKLQSESHTLAYSSGLPLCEEKSQITEPRSSSVYSNFPSYIVSSYVVSPDTIYLAKCQYSYVWCCSYLRLPEHPLSVTQARRSCATSKAMRVEKADIREPQPEHMITTFSKLSEELALKNTDSKVLRPSTTRRWIASMLSRLIARRFWSRRRRGLCLARLQDARRKSCIATCTFHNVQFLRSTN